MPSFGAVMIGCQFGNMPPGPRSQQTPNSVCRSRIGAAFNTNLRSGGSGDGGRLLGFSVWALCARLLRILPLTASLTSSAIALDAE